MQDVGKPINHAKVEMRASVAMIESVLGRFEEDLSSQNERYRRRPLGTVALITPYNNPDHDSRGQVRGCPGLREFGGVENPLRRAGGWLWRSKKLLSEAGLPNGHSESSVWRSEGRPQVDAAAPVSMRWTLSGGVAAGYAAKAVWRLATHPVASRIGREHNAALVWGEVDWSDVAGQVLRGAFGFAGQRCTANRRLIVSEKDFEVALASLREALEDYPVGAPGRSVGRLWTGRFGRTVTTDQRDSDPG